MKCTQEERLEIGRRIYDGEITRSDAAETYGICEATARDYMRLYRDANHLPPRRGQRGTHRISARDAAMAGLLEIESMTREELIDALVMARINEARLKKGYEVRGDGTVILYGSRNTR